MPGFISDGPLARELIRIGEDAIAREDDAALRTYFAEDYVFHAASRAPFGPRRAQRAIRFSAIRVARCAARW